MTVGQHCSFGGVLTIDPIDTLGIPPCVKCVAWLQARRGFLNSRLFRDRVEVKEEQNLGNLGTESILNQVFVLQILRKAEYCTTFIC